jgi:hypothetical protein
MSNFANELDLDLVGVDENYILDQMDEIMGLGRGVSRSNPQAKKLAQIIAKKSSRKVISTNNLTGKAEFEKRFSMLDDIVRKELTDGKKHIVDSALYSIVEMSALTNKELMSNGDDKVEGKTNINGRKLEAG